MKSIFKTRSNSSTPAENPLEMGMERLVDFEKPDFIGKTALEAIRAEGTRRKVVGVFMDGDAFEKNNEHRWPVFSDAEKVGHVSSAVYSPRLERNIGFALLDAAHSSDSGALRVETAEGLRNITITSLPFVDPDKKIPRASLRKD